MMNLVSDNVVSDIESFRHLPDQSLAKTRGALLFSIVLHALILIATLILVFFSQRKPAMNYLERDRQAEIVLVTNLANQPPLFQTRATQQSPELRDDAALPRSEWGDALPSAAHDSEYIIAEFDLPNDDNSGALSKPSHRDLLSHGKLTGFTVRPSTLSAADAALMAAEQARMKALLPQGDPVQVSLFGIAGTPSYSFVFLLDCSKSMGESDLNVLESAKVELLHGVQRLQPNHRFQVIAYNEKTNLVGPQRRMLKPTEETMQQARQSIATLYAAGGTSHANALSVAIGLQPDVIFLLTDAGRPIPSAGEIRQIIENAQREKTSIYCIQFGKEPEGGVAEFLTSISGQTGGEAKFVRVSAISKNGTAAD